MSLKRFLNKTLLNRNIIPLARYYSQETQNAQENPAPTKSGYAKAFEKFQSLEDADKEKLQTFKQLLMKSKFIDVSIILLNYNLKIWRKYLKCLTS